MSKRISEYDIRLKQSMAENEALKKQLANFDKSHSTYDSEVTRRITTYEQTITNFQREN